VGSVARSIIDAVAVHGATTVFGLPGVHNLAFWKVAEGAPLVVRHEQAAVYAADGWARATGRLGAAVVTTGPGAANALAAFGEAAAARSPVLLVASEIPQSLRREGRLRGVLHESRDQAGLFRPLAKAVFTPRSAAEVAATLDAAVAAAMRHPRGPVYMDVPADVLGHDAVHGQTAPRPEPEPTGAQLDAAPPTARGSAHWFEPPPADVDLDAAAAVLAGGGELRRPRRAAYRAPVRRRAATPRARGGGSHRAGRCAAGRRR
jgi:acetolactate synthase-1/2/3 large subunit